MDKEDFIEAMTRFIKHIKEYAPDAYEWVVEDMDKNELFTIYGLNVKEQFEEQI